MSSSHPLDAATLLAHAQTLDDDADLAVNEDVAAVNVQAMRAGADALRQLAEAAAPRPVAAQENQSCDAESIGPETACDVVSTTANSTVIGHGHPNGPGSLNATLHNLLQKMEQATMDATVKALWQEMLSLILTLDLRQPVPPPAESQDIETLAYQARVMGRCQGGMKPTCREDAPAMPSSWCSGCLIAALLAQVGPVEHLCRELNQRDTDVNDCDAWLREARSQVAALTAQVQALTEQAEDRRPRTLDTAVKAGERRAWQQAIAVVEQMDGYSEVSRQSVLAALRAASAKTEQANDL